MTSWTDIHKDFGKKYWGETHQQKWENADITKGEAKEWIELGFLPHDYWTVKKWKNFNFSTTETKTWLEVGLDKEEDSEFAFWLRTNNHIPELVKNNLEQLRNDYEEFRTNNSQTWLEQTYLNHNIKELSIYNLKGKLNLSQYQQLERLCCYPSNNLTNIILPTSLKVLDLSNNNFPEQDLSFLVPCINLEWFDLGNNQYAKFDQDIYNKFTGSLDYLSGMEKLKKIDISNTDINEVNIDKLPRSLWKIEYSTKERPDCKLTALVPLLEKHFGNHGRCLKCFQLNTSENWCQPCAEKEWKQLTGQELINKFIEQQGKNRWGDVLPWIPYEEFTDIKHLADGGFSKIYKVKCKEIKKYDKYAEEDVVLKSLNSSQNITSEFLTEIANTKLIGGFIVDCYGISQDPKNKNYLMVMEYKEGGNLRQCLQNKDNELDLSSKLIKLNKISFGLNKIHYQNLVHQDFHSGNIVGFKITDLGLSRLVNQQNQTGKIFGVLPYVAPEVLQGKPYTQKADIYSWGIIAYELLSNSYPYSEMNNTELALKVCQGLRPNLDKVPLPLLLKDLIKRCWDTDPERRPTASELYGIVISWRMEIRDEQNTPFYQQYKEIEEEYKNFSKKPYKIHGSAILHSKAINTKQINELLTKQFGTKDLDLDLDMIEELEINDQEEQIQTHQEMPPKQ